MADADKLEAIDFGNVLSYLGVEWTVIEKNVRHNSGYIEIQWTLRGQYGDEAYLLKSEEKKEGNAEVTWEITRPTNLDAITYERYPGQWDAFQEKDLPASAPKTVKFVEVYFNFDEATTVDAADDDGNIVPKTTWDYYTSDRQRNLAVEIWKEEDRDYPEAYDGKVIDPSAFEILERKASVSSFGAASGGALETLKSGVGGFFMMGLVLVGNGLPMDVYCFFAPLAAVLFMLFAQRPPARLWVSSVAVWAAVAALAHFGRFALSFWYITAACAVLSIVLPRFMAAVFPGTGSGGWHQTAIYGVFPGVWVYSCLQYFVFAPGPRAGYQLGAALLLPLAATCVCALLGRITEGSNG